MFTQHMSLLTLALELTHKTSPNSGIGKNFSIAPIMRIQKYLYQTCFHFTLRKKGMSDLNCSEITNPKWVCFINYQISTIIQLNACDRFRFALILLRLFGVFEE